MSSSISFSDPRTSVTEVYIEKAGTTGKTCYEVLYKVKGHSGAHGKVASYVKPGSLSKSGPDKFTFEYDEGGRETAVVSTSGVTIGGQGFSATSMPSSGEAKDKVSKSSSKSAPKKKGTNVIKAISDWDKRTREESERATAEAGNKMEESANELSMADYDVEAMKNNLEACDDYIRAWHAYHKNDKDKEYKRVKTRYLRYYAAMMVASDNDKKLKARYQHDFDTYFNESMKEMEAKSKPAPASSEIPGWVKVTGIFVVFFALLWLRNLIF